LLNDHCQEARPVRHGDPCGGEVEEESHRHERHRPAGRFDCRRGVHRRKVHGNASLAGVQEGRAASQAPLQEARRIRVREAGRAGGLRL
jgi:hypothetical protein